MSRAFNFVCSSFLFIAFQDSAYMALSASSLREIVKSEKLDEYQRGLTSLCDDAYNPVGDRWFPRQCCAKHAKFDKRVPGLFKTEYEGDTMIGLCSKTYIVARADGGFKFSSKGISTRLVKEPLQLFKNVLDTGKPASGRNKGFRARNNGIYSYNQIRCGFSYLYCKRRVLDDGIHTVPLDIVLCPKKNTKENTDAEEEEAGLIDRLTTEELINMLE